MFTKLFNSPLFIPFFALCILSFTACEKEAGSGPLVTETRAASGFTGLDIRVPGTVEVTTDSVFFVEVTCQENIIQHLETTVKGGQLRVRFDCPVKDVDGLLIRVSAPALNEFELDGSGRILVYDKIQGNILKTDVDGSGSIVLDEVDFNQTDVEISGSGKVEIFGECEDLHVEISGSGSANLLDYPVNTASAEVSGSGCARLNVAESLSIEVSGSGCVEYLGDPEVTQDISGSGKIRKL